MVPQYVWGILLNSGGLTVMVQDTPEPVCSFLMSVFVVTESIRLEGTSAGFLFNLLLKAG